VIKKNVSSHKNPIVSLQWLPNAIEIDKRNIYNILDTMPGEIH